MIEFYQHLPIHINPVAFSVGFLEIRWYAIMYLVGFGVVYWLLRYRIKETNYIEVQSAKFKVQNYSLKFKVKDLDNFFVYAVIGLLVGARLGYVLFYNFSYFWNNPLAIISPYDFSTGVYTGISGMSYFGGLSGIILATLIFIKRYKIDFWRWADFVVPAVPAGYFFGRIGNFLNGELYGRATDKFSGMYFSGGGAVLRHPSQLYEAFFEGVVLFFILWTLRNSPPTILGEAKINEKKSITSHILIKAQVIFSKMVGGKSKFSGQLLVIYIFGYGLIRFVVEFFREPDEQIGLFFNFLTLGQILSGLLMILAIGLGLWRRKKKMLE